MSLAPSDCYTSVTFTILLLCHLHTREPIDFNYEVANTRAHRPSLENRSSSSELPFANTQRFLLPTNGPDSIRFPLCVIPRRDCHIHSINASVFLVSNMTEPFVSCQLAAG